MPAWAEDASDFRTLLLKALVESRAELPPLVVNPALQAMAEAYAHQLAASGKLSHALTAATGLKQRWLAANGSPGQLGEILGAAADPQALVQAWMDSPTHRAVLRDRRWTAWGLGLVALPNTTVVVIDFWQAPD